MSMMPYDHSRMVTVMNNNELFSQRCDAISFFSDDNFHLGRIPSMTQISFPNFTRLIVDGISSSKSIGFDLALLGFLPSIAAAERGKHRVVLSDGRKNSLSCIFHVGAESGAGKGRAIEETLSFFSSWDKKLKEQIMDENKKRTDENDLIKLHIEYLKKEYRKNLDDKIAQLLLQEKGNIKKLLPIPHLLMSDVTAQAYTQELVNYGVAIRLESDGTMLPDATMRIVNKAWSGEVIQRTRLGMPDGISHDPFIVEMVMTQPEFFHEHISNFRFMHSGRLARTLVYFYNVNNFKPNQPAHELDPQIRELFHKRLGDLLSYSFIKHEEKTPIFLEKDAESLFLKREQEWHDQCKSNGLLHRINDFGERMGQHTLRLAGILHIAENGPGSQSKITFEVMDIATRMVEIFAHHVSAYRIKDYRDVSRECCRDVMLYILKRNFSEVMQTELNQALKHRYTANDIKVALFHLQRFDYIREKTEFIPYGGKPGRPNGKIFVNPFYEHNGTTIF